MEEVTQDEIVKACKDANIVSPLAPHSISPRGKSLLIVRLHHVAPRWIRD